MGDKITVEQKLKKKWRSIENQIFKLDQQNMFQNFPCDSAFKKIVWHALLKLHV